jgi:hypothetical protein
MLMALGAFLSLPPRVRLEHDAYHAAGCDTISAAAMTTRSTTLIGQPLQAGVRDGARQPPSMVREWPRSGNGRGTAGGLNELGDGVGMAIRLEPCLSALVKPPGVNIIRP